MGKVFMDGNEAVVLGALYAGCRFFAGYPITPATGIYQGMLERLPKMGGMALQAEDEIASLGYCLGASMAGIKAMTATSGPGISLCSEHISFAVGSEIPVVVVNVMRQGPSTGSATRGADGDVQFMRWGHSGGLPVIVLAPAGVPDCFTLTVRAFNLSERFRCPVFVASGKEIAMTRETVDVEALETIPVVNRRPHREGPFLPFGVPPGRDVPDFLPIGGPVPVRQTSSTHGADGHITTDPELIQAGVERLRRKIESHGSEMTYYDWEPDDGAAVLLIAYGVTWRAARTATRTLRERGVAVSLLGLKTLWPFPEETVRRAAEGAHRVIVVEMNLGQMVREVERVLCPRPVEFYGRMCGRLIGPEEIRQAVLHGAR